MAPASDLDDGPTTLQGPELIGLAQQLARERPPDAATTPLGPEVLAIAQAIAQEGKPEREDETTDPERVQTRQARPTERNPAVTPVGLSDRPEPRSDARPKTEPNSEVTHVGVVPARPPQLPEDDDPTGVLPAAPRPGPPVADDDDETTAELGLSAVPSRKPGAYSRANLADESRPEDSDISRVVRYEAMQNSGHRRHGFQIAIAAVMLSLAAGAVALMLLHHDRPSLEALQVAYPYGFSGGRLPNGRAAPPATQVLYEYESTVDCGDAVCARYTVRSADGSFRIEMNLRKEDGEWRRVDAP